jgi:hypothetical protein
MHIKHFLRYNYFILGTIHPDTFNCLSESMFRPECSNEMDFNQVVKCVLWHCAL